MSEAPIVVLDYGIGNLRSAEKALQHLGARAELVTAGTRVDGAAGVVLPGVGAFGACAEALAASGLGDAARRAIGRGVPFLGICVGMQLLYEASEESPGARGLGVLAGTVRRLSGPVKLPQMQWNRLDRRAGTHATLLDGLPEHPWVYFVHGFAPEVGSTTVATCDYGGTVAAMLEAENLWGVQFHPEKSGALGLAILANFVTVCRAHARVPAGER
ncbi:MAG: imidazole glycerol phosphate synthase subunit HisH [Actinomycetota bacterium]|nr:imidazole glycerol phosphate synthase subunit HisH [Actinomycetota bacterium]